MIIIGIVALLIVIRLILPHVVLHYANDKLAHLPGYHGHVKDIQIHLYRGTYILKDFSLNKIDSTSKKETEFFKSGTIDLSLEWGALFRRAIVGKLALHSPILTLTKEETKEDAVKKDPADFPKLLKSFMPIRVNRFEISDGSLRYVDPTSLPNVALSLKNIHVLAINLTNETSNTVELPSTVTAEAEVYEGLFNFHMKLNLPAQHPTFKLDAELKGTNLVLLNDLFKTYGKFEVSTGDFGLYTEMAAKEGKFIGYVKPVIKDLKVTGLKDPNKSVFQKGWEALVGGVAFVFKNKPKDQLATKVPIEGTFSDPKANIFSAIGEVLQNAFIQALTSSIDNEISMGSIKVGSPKETKPDTAGGKKTGK